MAKSMKEIHDDAIRATENAWTAGFIVGLQSGRRRLEALAAIVPSSVTKQWLIGEIRRHADAMRAKSEPQSGRTDGE